MAKTIYQKLFSKPLVYQINLPNKSDWIYLSLYFKAGHIFAGEKNHIPHLFEHYLYNLLVQKGIPEKNIHAYTNNEFMGVDLRFLQKDTIKILTIVLESLYNLDFSRNDIFQQEREKVYQEVQKRAKDINVRLGSVIDEEILSPGCPYVKIDDFSRVDSIQQYTLQDIKSFYRTNIVPYSPWIFWGGYAISEQATQEVKSLIKKYTPQNIVFLKTRRAPQCQVLTQKIADITNSFVSKGVFLSLAFPSYPRGGTDIVQRRAVQILLEDIKNHSYRYSLDGKLKKIGITPSQLYLSAYQKFGYFYYLFSGEETKILPILKIFKETIEEFKNSDVLSQIISESLKDVYSQKSSSNSELFYDWGDSLVTGEEPLTQQEFLQKIFSLKPSFFQKIMDDLFNWRKMNILIIHNNQTSVDIKSIKSWEN